MKKFKQTCRILVMQSVLLLVFCISAFSKDELKITAMKLEYPCPAVPFYHLRADLELPVSSMIEAEVVVNGKTLRYINLYKDTYRMDMTRPALIERPPSGAGLSQDNTLYKNFYLTGWVKWEPGKTYDIKVNVRMKKNIRSSPGDVIISSAGKITAPLGVEVFDPAWKNYKSLVLSETAGLGRKAEPVEVLLPFYPDEAKDLKREIRVVSVDPATYKIREVPSQVYDIQEYLVEDDLAPDSNGKPTRDVPVWLPAVTARLSFLADVPARTCCVYLVYYNNPDAIAKVYDSDLDVKGESPGLQIENEKMSVILHPNSGHLDQITLKSRPGFPLYHRKETNGAIHWNPEIYSPPRPWTHTSDWKPPQNIRSFTGPVAASSEVWGSLRDIPEVDASVRYMFFPGKSYFLSSTMLRMNESLPCLALRNGEIVIKRELITHAAWYDVIRDSVINYDVTTMPDLTDLKMEADVPWLCFYNKNEGVGFAGIQLSYSNTGLESAPRLLNPYFYITGGPWIYWARALILSFHSSNMQQMIPAPKGSIFSEKWAYFIFELDKGGDPFKPVTDLQKELLNPLRVQLVEEVDDRVSRTVTELYIDKGKSGWEGRETGTHSGK